MLIGAIDVGSYSTRLGIAKLEKNNVEFIYEEGQITSIGSGVKESGFLSKEAIERCISILKRYKEKLLEFGVVKFKAVGTEALRIAKNKDELLERAKKELSIEIDVIDSKTEGELSYKATVFSLKEINKEICVVDQGGASTEYVFGNGFDIKKNISKSFGIVSLTESFIKSDPPTKEEIQNLLNFLDREIKELKQGVDLLIGLGGTITTIAALELDIYPYDSKKIHGQRVSFESIKKWFEKLSPLKVEQRKAFKQIEDKRAKDIVSGIGIFYKTLEIFEKDFIIISDYGLRHGVILREAGLI